MRDSSIYRQISQARHFQSQAESSQTSRLTRRLSSAYCLRYQSWRFLLLCSLAIGSFLPSAAYAENLYVQQSDNSGTINIGHGAGAAVIGSFTLSASTTISADAEMNFFVKSTALGAVGPMIVDITPTTGSGTFRFAFDLPAVDGNFHSLSTTTETAYVGTELGPGAYDVYADNNSIFNTTLTQSDAGGSEFYGYIQNGGTPPDGNVNTRIITVTPPNGTTVATSSAVTIGTEVYLSLNDYLNGGNWSAQIELLQNNFFDVQVGASPSLFTEVFRWSLAPGYTELSTTTEIMTVGSYTLRTTIRKSSVIGSVLDFFGFGSSFGVVVSTTTQFYAARPSQFDVLSSTTRQALIDFSENASSTATLADCGNLFNISQCVAYFVQPSAGSISQYSDLGEDLSRKPPFGYWTLAKDMLSTTTASTTPGIALQGASAVAEWFAVLILGISNLILLVAAVWMFQRISLWDWH